MPDNLSFSFSELSISEEDGKKMENTLIKGFNKLLGKNF